MSAFDAETGRERLLGGYPGRLLLTASVGWATIQAGRLVLSPLLPAITADLGISDFHAGFALTTLWGLYALAQFPSGRLSDRLSRKTLLVPALGVLVLGFGLLSVAPSYLVFLAGAAVIGAGAGLYPTAARALVSDLFVERRGQAFGLHTASGDLGGALAAGLAVVALGSLALPAVLAGTTLGEPGWRRAFLPVMVVLALVLLAIHRWSREPYRLDRIDLGVGETGRRLLAGGRFRWLLLAYSLYAFTWQSAVGFLPTYLQAKGFSAGFASGGFAVLFLVGAVVKPAAGGLGDRVSKAGVAAAALGVGAVALAAVIVSSRPLVVTGAVVVFAAGLMAYPPVMQAHLMDSFPTESMGGDLGAARTVYIGIGSLGPSYVGYVADQFAFAPAFGTLVVCLLGSGLIVSALDRSGT